MCHRLGHAREVGSRVLPFASKGGTDSLDAREELMEKIATVDPIEAEWILHYLNLWAHPNMITAAGTRRRRLGEQQIVQGEAVLLRDWRQAHPDV